MADRNSITVLQLNPTGLSNAKQILLNKYFEEQKPDFVAFNETKKKVLEDFSRTTALSRDVEVLYKSTCCITVSAERHKLL